MFPGIHRPAEQSGIGERLPRFGGALRLMFPSWRDLLF
jgi:hypothetical protein